MASAASCKSLGSAIINSYFFDEAKPTLLSSGIAKHSAVITCEKGQAAGCAACPFSSERVLRWELSHASTDQVGPRFRYKKEIVLRVLDETGWNRKECTKRLHISYKALRNKLKRWDLKRCVLTNSLRTTDGRRAGVDVSRSRRCSKERPTRTSPNP